MEVDVGRAGGEVEEAEVNSRDAEQAFDDNAPHGEYAFLPATCQPDAHPPVVTC
jgi:hypothetical protein